MNHGELDPDQAQISFFPFCVPNFDSQEVHFTVETTVTLYYLSHGMRLCVGLCLGMCSGMHSPEPCLT